MQRTALCLAGILLLAMHQITAQVSVTVNGSSTQGTMTSGDSLRWVITCPVGSMVMNQLVVDADSNGRFDPATDRSIFTFSQTDGQPGNDGPGDNDGVANGVIMTTFAAGLAPAHWILITVQGAASDSVRLRVSPLASPSAFITGTVSGPGGSNIANILIEASPQSSEGMDFWHGLTNSAGQYSIAMGEDAASKNPWNVRMGGDPGSLKGLVESPRVDTNVTVGTTPVVVHFNLVAGTVLTGIIKDDSGVPVHGANPHTHDPANPESSGGWYDETGSDGIFYLVVPQGSYLLHFTAQGYKDEWYNGQTSSSTATTILVTTQDTIRNLNGTLVKAGLIRGKVTNGGQSVDATVSLHNAADGSEISTDNTYDGGKYAFTVDPGSYFVKFEYNGQIRWHNNTTTYPPPDTLTITGTETIDNVDIDFAATPTGVDQGTTEPIFFALEQNYPNPFNPSTTIGLRIQDRGIVKVSVFDVLGREVALLLNEELVPGKYTSTWNAHGMASGMYFYRLDVRSEMGDVWVETKKMLLVR